ncbi:MAG: Ig-like domain-containing protein, partial [Candidatus Latescibacterota bacterium]
DAGKEVEVTVSSGGIIDKKSVKLPGKAGTVGDLRISPEESTILADGAARAQLNVFLTGMNGEPLSNQTVHCELLPEFRTLGKVDPSALTGDPNAEDVSPGKAQVWYTGAASIQDRTVKIRIFSGDKADTVSVHLKGITLIATTEPDILPPDGQSRSTINVLVKETTTHVPIAGRTVRFGASLGFIGGSSDTDNNGVARTQFTAPKDPSITASNPVDAKIFVSFGNKLEIMAPITIREIRTQGLELFASPSQIPANGTSISNITALLRDNNSNPVVGELIRFTTDLGTITAMDSTDANGRAEAVLVSDRRNGQARITAQFKNTTRTIPVNFTGVKLSISATPENLFAGGNEKTTVTAFVKDAADVSIVGESVLFEAFLNGKSITTSEMETDVAGKASYSISATEAGQCLIRVSAAGAVDSSYVTFNRMQLTLTGKAVKQAGSDSLAVSTGGDSIRVWAQLYDTVNNRYVANTSIEFFTTLGSIGKSAMTNSQGVATTYLVSGNTAGTPTVLASATYLGQRISKEKQFIFVPSSEVGKVALRVDPNIASIGGGSSALIAVVTDKFGNPVSNALVSFKLVQGPAGGEYIHPITSTTGSSGVATTYFYSGQVPSQFETVHIEAEVGGVQSNIAKLTIAGAPETIQPSYPTLVDLETLDNGDGTLTLPISASVLDINSNYVVDGTTVYFKIDPPEGAVLSPVKTKDSVAASKITYPATSAGKTVELTASAGGREGKIRIPLPGFNVSYLSVNASPSTIPADGKSTAIIRATIFDFNGSSAFVPDGITVSFTTDAGTIDPPVATTKNGVATAILTSDKTSKYVTVTAQSGTSKYVAFVYFEEVGLSVNQVADIELSVSKPIIEADGTSASAVTATLRKFNGDIIDTPTTVEFSANIGEISQFVRSDSNGKAVARFTSGVVGTAEIKAKVGNTVNYTNVIIVPGKPHSIQLSFDNTTVGVQGSGRNETLLIKGNVKDNKNNPVADGVRVKFELVGAHDSAVSLTPQGGTPYISSPVATVNGFATVSFHSGSRAGAHRIKATVVDSLGAVIQPIITSEATQFMVVSGPAFLDTSNLNDPFTNSRITVAGGPLNIFAGELGTVNSKSTITVMVSDRYNNPVPEGTAVYFTTTGGSIDTKTGFTNAQGMASVTLFAGNPLPTLQNSMVVENPNKSLGGPATFDIPFADFDFDGIPNNGIATVIAYTQGVDQSGRQVTVWNYRPIVFSQEVSMFSVDPGVTTVLRGQSTEITVIVHDLNGNPIVGGSTIEFSTQMGALSNSKITTNTPGVTVYTVTLTNDLDPLVDTAGNTVVTVRVKSPNGEYTKQSVPIFMSVSSQ